MIVDFLPTCAASRRWTTRVHFQRRTSGQVAGAGEITGSIEELPRPHGDHLVGYMLHLSWEARPPGLWRGGDVGFCAGQLSRGSKDHSGCSSQGRIAALARERASTEVLSAAARLAEANR